jgi:hypothetical protein
MSTKTKSVAELKQELAAAKEAERQAKIQLKEQYEKDRNDLVVSLISVAVDVSGMLQAFKQESMEKLKAWFERMRDYGNAKENQENFQILSTDGSLKIVFSYSISKGFDERSKLAEEKLKEYLTQKVKKRDLQSFNFIMSLLERNKVNGELDVSNIQRLYKLEQEINDEIFTESMNLFRESYKEQGSKYYARFYKKDADEKFVQIPLDFAAI